MDNPQAPLLHEPAFGTFKEWPLGKVWSCKTRGELQNFHKHTIDIGAYRDLTNWRTDILVRFFFDRDLTAIEYKTPTDEVFYLPEDLYGNIADHAWMLSLK